jgi:hypothetical protein
MILDFLFSNRQPRPAKHKAAGLGYMDYQLEDDDNDTRNWPEWGAIVDKDITLVFEGYQALFDNPDYESIGLVPSVVSVPNGKGEHEYVSCYLHQFILKNSDPALP